MDSFTAILDREMVTIVNIDVQFPDVLITYVDVSGNCTSKTKTIQGRTITLGVVA